MQLALKCICTRQKHKNSRKRHCARGQRKENPDRVKNQSDCWIRYRTLLDTNKDLYNLLCSSM